MSSSEYILLRVYYEFERPRNGIVKRLSASSPVSGAQILSCLRGHYDGDRYAAHVYDDDVESFAPLSESEDVSIHAEEDPSKKLSRIDVKLVQAKPIIRADALLCKSSETDLTGSWFGIGIVRGKTASNHGSLWRSALQFGAGMTFTIGKRYDKKVEGNADIFKTYRQMPCIGYESVAAFMTNSPVDAQVVVIEYGGEELVTFEHPKRAVYVLGSEDAGVPPALVTRAHKHVAIPTADGRPSSLNVAAAGAIVLYDRHIKMMAKRSGKKTEDAPTTRNARIPVR